MTGTTIAGTTPYAWPFDGSFDLATRATLVVVLAPGPDEAHPAWRQVEELAAVLGAAGAKVVSVDTRAPRLNSESPAPLAFGVDARLVSSGVDGFYDSGLDPILRRWGRDQLLLVGRWLETSVHSTMRSANDRGYECLLVADACEPFDPSLVAAAVSHVEMSGGIFGAVGTTENVLCAAAF
jgi:biuret amidohydrolase